MLADDQQGQQRADAGGRQRRQDGDGVDVALVEHAEHDVDRHHRGEDQPRLARERGAELGCFAGKRATDGARQPDGGLRVGDGRHRLVERDALGGVEADREGGELLLVADGEGRAFPPDRGDGRQRHLRAVGSRGGQHRARPRRRRDDVGGGERLAGVGAGQSQCRKRRGIRPVARLHLEHHPILVRLPVDGRDLPLGERVVEDVRHRLQGHAVLPGAHAVDDDAGGEAFVLFHGVDVAEARIFPEFCDEARTPLPHLRAEAADERVLVLAEAAARRDLHVLHRSGEGRRARDLADLVFDLLRDRRGRPPARLVRHEHDRQRGDVRRGIERTGAHDADDIGDLRYGTNPLRGRALDTRDLREGHVRVGLHGHRDEARVLQRQEALRHEYVERKRQSERHGDDEQGHALVPQDGGERGLVEADEAGAEALDRPFALALAGAVVRLLEQGRAHHRRQGQRDDGRDHHGDGERQGELAEHAPDEAAHEQQRDEHGEQRGGQRDDREPDLRGTVEGGRLDVLAVLAVPRDVLDHDDGVVDDEAGADGQRHQGEIVEAEAREPHHRERADQRQRQGRAGDDRGRPSAQEQQHDQHHEADAQRERELNLVDRGADHARAVADDGEGGVRGERLGEPRHLRLDARHRRHDVGAGLAPDVDDDRRLALVPGANALVLEAVGYAGDVAQQHGRAVAVGDRDLGILGRARDLVVGGDGVRLRLAVERALGRGDVGGRDGGADVFEAEPIGGERLEVGLHADSGLEAALHADAADARHFAQPLTDERVGEIGEIAQRQRIGGECKGEDRRVGRVDLGVDGRIGEGTRQRRAGRIDRRLHVLRRPVDVAAQVELQRDLAEPERTGRRQEAQGRDLAELAFERRRHERGHRLGIGAGQARGDGDGREIDLRQRGDGQATVAQNAEDQHRHRQKRGGDGSCDEGRRNAHCVTSRRRLPLPSGGSEPCGAFASSPPPARAPPLGPLGCSPAAAGTTTARPSDSCAKPTVTTVSPGLSSPFTTARTSSCQTTSTLRSDALLSATA